jgi:hypothetical protein
MEDITRTHNDVTRITNGIVQLKPFHNFAGGATTCVNVYLQDVLGFSSVYNCNLIMISNIHPNNGQYYATNATFNI